MFTPDFYIDMLQNSKKAATNQVMTDAVINKAAMNFIDAQTAFAKMLVTNATEIAQYAFETQSEFFFPKKEQLTSKRKSAKVEL